MNILFIGLWFTLLNKVMFAGVTDEMWVPKFMKIVGKLRTTLVGDEWRLNEQTTKKGSPQLNWASRCCNLVIIF